ncbi:MAG: hypothetical protein K2X66_11940 [Cyanobacteria bacterium]|nr:hypothetical protein [Cyanobacteriota bacterium]
MKKLLLVLALFSIVAQPAMARNFGSFECPIVGDTKTKAYYLPSNPQYGFKLNDTSHGDNRNCFKTEKLAKDASYHRAPGGAAHHHHHHHHKG